MKTFHDQYPKPTTESVIDPDTRRTEFLKRKRNQHRFAKRAGALAFAVVAGAAGISAINNHNQEQSKIVHAYYGDVQPGGTVIGAAKEIADEHHIGLNAVEVGQDASSNESEEHNKSYVAQPGDTLIVYTNADDGYVSSEIITGKERTANK